jgi:hypothetical protein
MDLVLWDRLEGLIELQDHKTTKDGIQSLERRLPLNTQVTGYLRAIRRLLGVPNAEFWSHTPAAARELFANHYGEISRLEIGTVTFNVSRRARPHVPKRNKLTKKAARESDGGELFADQERDGVPRGEVSVAQIDTTAEVYGEALLEQVTERNLPITEKQQALWDSLKGRVDTYYGQLEFYRGPAELERWRSEMWVESRGLRAASRDPGLRTRNPGACTSPGSPPCAYSALCTAPDDPEARGRYRVAETAHEEVTEARK